MVTKATSKTSKKQVKKTPGKPAAKKVAAHKDLVLVTAAMSNQSYDLSKFKGSFLEKKDILKILKSEQSDRKKTLKSEQKDLRRAVASKSVLEKFLKQFASKLEALFAPVKHVQYWDEMDSEMDSIVNAKRSGTECLKETNDWIKQIESDIKEINVDLKNLDALISKVKSVK